MLCFSSFLKCFSLCLQDAWRQKGFFPWPVLPCLCCPYSQWGVERLSATVLTNSHVLLKKTKSYISRISLCRSKYTAKGGWNIWYEHAEGFCSPSRGCLLYHQSPVTVPSVLILFASQLHPSRFKYLPVQSMLPPPRSSLPFTALWSILTALSTH